MVAVSFRPRKLGLKTKPKAVGRNDGFCYYNSPLINSFLYYSQFVHIQTTATASDCTTYYFSFCSLLNNYTSNFPPSSTTKRNNFIHLSINYSANE